MINNYRHEVEKLILNCFISQDKSNEMDKMEYEEFIIPYELFKTSRTHKQVAKAIFILQTKKEPISDITVLNFIESNDKFNSVELLSVISGLWCTFDTMKSYLQILKKIDEDENKMRKLEGLI